MQVTALKRYRAFKVGDEYEVPDGAANVLIRRGILEPTNIKQTPKPKRKRGRPCRSSKP